MMEYPMGHCSFLRSGCGSFDLYAPEGCNRNGYAAEQHPPGAVALKPPLHRQGGSRPRYLTA
jgi:hypothetical protein